MSSITIIPTTTSSSSNYHPNINILPMHPSYLLPNFPHQQNPPSYPHLVQPIPKKTSLYGARHRKYNNFNKFQTGTTTTFSGYTNMTGNRQINLRPIPAPHCYLPPPSSSYHHNNNNSHYNRYHHQQQNNNYIQNLPSLLDTNPFHFPSHHNTRKYNHAQQYNPNNYQYHHSRALSRSRFHILSQLPSKSSSRSRSQHYQPPPIKARRNHQHYHNNNNIHRSPSPSYNNNYENYNNNHSFEDLILSDSMCSRVRTYAIRKLNVVDVELSYESGCDIIKMINWLQTPDAQRMIHATSLSTLQ
ncbi:unnamed protein product [Rotaria sp. Silwood1]|nr:unnamed protein product [Rotaria sp. Silwood1]CAF5002095.1 unnamed protein product [Rotaria sp. Silwood1]